jgi:hypothetical protein
LPQNIFSDFAFVRRAAAAGVAAFSFFPKETGGEKTESAQHERGDEEVVENRIHAESLRREMTNDE